jgi:tetratricopeptide (TPR) repeat protein
MMLHYSIRYLILWTVCFLLTIATPTISQQPIASPSTLNICNTNDRTAQQYYHADQFQAAQTAWELAYTCYQQHQAHQQTALILSNLAATHNKLGEFQQTLDTAQKALKLAEPFGDTHIEINILGNLGVAYRATGKYDKSLNTYQKALKLATTLKETQLQADLLGNIANLEADLGNHNDALKNYQKGLMITQQRKDLKRQGTILRGIASNYFSQGEDTKAIAIYQQSLSIARQAKDLMTQANILNNLGIVYLSHNPKQHDLDQASKFLHESLALSQKLKSSHQIATTWIGLGMLAEAKQQSTEAIQHYKKSLAIARSNGDRRTEGIALNIAVPNLV